MNESFILSLPQPTTGRLQDPLDRLQRCRRAALPRADFLEELQRLAIQRGLVTVVEILVALLLAQIAAHGASANLAGRRGVFLVDSIEAGGGRESTRLR